MLLCLFVFVLSLPAFVFNPYNLLLLPSPFGLALALFRLVSRSGTRSLFLGVLFWRLLSFSWCLVFSLALVFSVSCPSALSLFIGSLSSASLFSLALLAQPFSFSWHPRLGISLLCGTFSLASLCSALLAWHFSAAWHSWLGISLLLGTLGSAFLLLLGALGLAFFCLTLLAWNLSFALHYGFGTLVFAQRSWLGISLLGTLGLASFRSAFLALHSCFC